MSRFAGKVVAVTGGASGLGAAIVRRLVSEGAHAAILDIDIVNAGRVATDAGNASVYRADVTDAAAMVMAIDRIIADHGRLDGAVNNAGVGGPFIPTADYPLDAWDRTIAINLTGVFHSLRAEI